LNVIVPTSSVAVTAPNTQTVGQPLTLTCNVTTVRGITSQVDIVWSRDGISLKRSSNILSSVMGSLLVHSDSYTISPLSTNDNGREYECTVIIHSSPVTMLNNTLILDVTGTVLTIMNHDSFS